MNREEKRFKTFYVFLMMLFCSNCVYAVEWNVSLWGKRRAFTEHIEKLAELVSIKTNGGFTLNLSYGGLSKNRENLDGISVGAFEMAQFCAGYHPDKNPTITVLELPFLNINSLNQERDISTAIYNHPAVKKDLARWNATILMPSPLPQYNVAGVGPPPRLLKDFKGIAVRATGGIGEAMKMLGAVPTSVSASEVRQALDGAIITAVSFAPHAHISFGTVSSVKWWTTNLNPGSVNCPVVVNTDALNSLPKNYYDALLGSVDESLDHYIEYYENTTMKKWEPLLQQYGIEKITYSDENLEAFKAKVAQPAAEKWIRENTARGIPARELYDFLQEKTSQ